MSYIFYPFVCSSIMELSSFQVYQYNIFLCIYEICMWVYRYASYRLCDALPERKYIWLSVLYTLESDLLTKCPLIDILWLLLYAVLVLTKITLKRFEEYLKSLREMNTRVEVIWDANYWAIISPRTMIDPCLLHTNSCNSCSSLLALFWSFKFHNRIFLCFAFPLFLSP